MKIYPNFILIEQICNDVLTIILAGRCRTIFFKVENYFSPQPTWHKQLTTLIILVLLLSMVLLRLLFCNFDAITVTILDNQKVLCNMLSICCILVIKLCKLKNV